MESSTVWLRRRRCEPCGRFQTVGRFDATFRNGDGEDRDFFGLPAWLCRSCERLTFDQELLTLHGLSAATFVAAIGSDQALSPRHMDWGVPPV